MLMPSPPALALRTVTRRRWSSSASGNCGGAAPGSAVPLNCAGSGSGPGSPSAGLTVSTSSARLSSPGCHRSPPAPKPAGVRSSSSPVRGARLPDAIFASERPRAATLPCPTVLGPFQPRTQGRWRRGQLGQRAPYPWPPGAGLLGAGPTGRGHGWERRMSCSPGVLRMRCGGSEGRRGEEEEEMPLLDCGSLKGHRELRLAHLVLGAITMGIVWQEGETQPQKVLPRALAIPFVEVSRNLGLPPILVHSDLILTNWTKRNPDSSKERVF
ncbi:uncharacterized protein LOC103749263 isoform X1 [Nannospalax galili]|uniref:uncharacterized protein LOC103749263 isoform X1 n=1 Tax=Nannospalax galili TaxID=1026970 RepID=UPI00111C2B3B|nr:uncharacterized protein LOC103749263 isoform X1 [Nannospalax galili]